jgi:hypothetical protein
VRSVKIVPNGLNVYLRKFSSASRLKGLVESTSNIENTEGDNSKGLVPSSESVQCRDSRMWQVIQPRRSFFWVPIGTGKVMSSLDTRHHLLGWGTDNCALWRQMSWIERPSRSVCDRPSPTDISFLTGSVCSVAFSQNRPEKYKNAILWKSEALVAGTMKNN